MKKKSTSEKEISNALNVLEKNNVSFYVIENNDLKDDWFYERLKDYKIKPTDENITKIRKIFIEMIASEASDCINDAIECLASRIESKKSYCVKDERKEDRKGRLD